MGQFKFFLDSEYPVPGGSRQEIIEPVSWDTRKPTIARSETYSGLFRSFTVNLEFIGNGYDYVRWVEDAFGILADVTVEIWEYNNKAHEYQLQDSGKLVFKTYSLSDKSGKGATIDVADTSFIEKIRSREDVLINYNKNTDLDGNPMSEPVYIEQTILGMDLVSKGSTLIKVDNPQWLTVPLYNFYILDIDVNGQIAGLRNPTREGTDPASPGFYSSFTAEQRREETSFYEAEADGEIILNGVFDFDTKVSNSGTTTRNKLDLVVTKLDNSTNVINLYETPSGNNITYNDIVVTLANYILSVDQGDVVTLQCNSGLPPTVSNAGFFNFRESSISLTLKDKADPTISKGAFIFDVFNRMTESITGQSNALVSPILSEGGLYHDYTLQNGLLIRNYLPEEAQMSFKLKDLFQDCEKVFNLALGEDDNKLQIRDKRAFFQNGVIHTITKEQIEADSFEKKTDTTYFYSDVEIGYAKSAYEEVSGLEEYNNKSAFNTILSTLNNKLEGVSKTRGDGFGMEFARRLQKLSDETEDSKYDKDNFFLNVVYNVDKWLQLTTEGFSDVSGIDFITTPINLNITPGQNLRRWGWMLATGLQKYTDKLIRFNTSDVDTDLSTTTDDGVTVAENQDISYSDLENPIFTGKKIIFSAPLSLEDYNKIKTGDNKYKLIKVWNPIDREYNFGWIREAGVEAVDKATNWELIEAKDVIEVLSYWTWNDGGRILWNDGGGILLNDQN